MSFASFVEQVAPTISVCFPSHIFSFTFHLQWEGCVSNYIAIFPNIKDLVCNFRSAGCFESQGTYGKTKGVNVGLKASALGLKWALPVM